MPQGFAYAQSRERERGQQGRLGFGSWGEGGLRPCPPLYGGLGGQHSPLLQSLADLDKEEWGASFPPFPYLKIPLGFPLGLGRLGLRGLVHLAQGGQGTSP